jgi:two-component system NtrC family sensor kinase
LITDETERHRLQSELISKHKELRKTFADLERQSRALTRLNVEIGEMSARLSQASSMAAIGEITAELTHQLNNPLAVAVSAARRIDMFLGDQIDHRVRDMVPLLKDSLERMKTTMNELKRVYRSSRSADAPMEPIDLKTQIDSALMLMQQRLGAIDLRMDIEPELPEILARSAEIQHVIVNLIDNAIQAVGDQGTISLKALQAKDQIVLLVGDSGPGIPAEQRERIFEPFFTTREQGSGLGLSVVRRNVQNNKAVIRVGQSFLGGAEFEIGFVTASR